MAGEAELKIGSESVEKTTAALDSLITTLEKLLVAQNKQTKINDDAAKSTDAVTNAVKQSEIARNKAIALLDLESKGLSKTSDSYSKLKGEILAQEVAAKKNIDTAEKDYQQLLENISAKEKAVAANKELVATTNSTTNALKASEAASIKANSLLSLQQRGLDELSDEYAELKAEILAKDVALRKGIDTESKEYKQILKTTKAQEVATARLKALRKAQNSANDGAEEGSEAFGKFAKGLDDAGKQVQVLDGPLGGIASRMTALSSILKSGAISLAAVGLGIGALVLGLRSGIKTASATEVAMKQLEAQVLITGGAAGYTAAQFDDMARSFAMSTLGSTEEMRGLISSLLVFDRVSGDAFSRTIALANDFQATGLSSAGEVVKKIGKALQDPVKNYTELKELGVDFNKEQYEAVKQAEALGDTYGAQVIILDALEGKVKGIAAAQADTLAGDLDTFGQKWSELWEKAASNAMPILREITQTANTGLDLILQSAETDSQTDLRRYKEEQNLTAQSTKTLKEEVTRLNDELAANAKRLYELSNSAIPLIEMSDSWGAVTQVVDPRFTAEVALLDKRKESLVMQKKEVSEVLQARESAVVSTKKLTLEQELFIESLEKELSGQKKVQDLFISTRDIRSAAYRQAKVEEETLAIAREKGLDPKGNKEEVDQIRRVIQAKSDLTEQNILLNISIQKEKSLLNQQDSLKKEIELNRLVGEGLQKNSLEYNKISALIDLRNKTLSSGGSITDDNFKRLEKETVALVELQAEMRKLTALRQFDSNSSTVQSLEKSIELNRLLATGVSETSDEYIRYNMELNARNTALQQGIDLESEDYQQLLDKAQAVADLQIKLQDLKDIESLGLTFDLSGGLIREDSLAGIQDAASRSIQTIMDVALSQGLEVDDPVIEALLASVNEKFQDEKNQLYLPLGLVVDEEGALLAVESADAVKLELRERLREMDAEAKELGIEDEIAYQERRAELIREYEDKANEARVESFRKSAENMSLIRAKDTADSISAGLANLSAVAGNNKKLAKLSKAAAVFSASVSLVQGIAEANKLPWPENIPAYAQAFLQGTQIIQMASSLNEPSFAFGGVDIQGAGTGRSDSIKANIARGESVITAPATSQYKDTLRRMNAGLPISAGGGNRSVSMPLSINIQGDASENTVRLIDESLRNFETRVQQISEGVSMETIQHEQNYGGLLNQF